MVARINIPIKLLSDSTMRRFRVSPVSDSQMYDVSGTSVWGKEWGEGFNLGVLSTVINISFAGIFFLSFFFFSFCFFPLPFPFPVPFPFPLVFPFLFLFPSLCPSLLSIFIFYLDQTPGKFAYPIEVLFNITLPPHTVSSLLPSPPPSPLHLPSFPPPLPPPHLPVCLVNPLPSLPPSHFFLSPLPSNTLCKGHKRPMFGLHHL